ncbi:MAG TPA: CapA family protein [Acidimicrobiia bacterium]|nr:CapA family protein [Acidimicrobiia bacterium]
MPATRRNRFIWAVLPAVLAAACGGGGTAPQPAADATPPGQTDAGAPDTVVRLGFAGDVMLGRRVAPVVSSDGASIFEAVRHELAAMDLAVANLESPFGDAGDSGDRPPRLVADPAAAQLLARAGFDAMNVANNHASDAGPSSVADTAARLEDVGLATLGRVDEPLIVERNGLRVALLAFDVTGQSPPDQVAHWDGPMVARTVAEARANADVVTVSLHGGVEYLPRPDPALKRKADQLAGWGVDVVWAHGSHVAHEVSLADPDGDGRVSVLAYGLGNFLFDQRIPGTTEGLLVEVLAAADGARGYRIGVVRHDDLRVSAVEWREPDGDAAWLDGWWTLATAPPGVTDETVDPALVAAFGTSTAVGIGDADGDGRDDLVAAFVRPLRPTMINQRFTEIDWTDRAGRSAHLGVYDVESKEPRWVAGSLPRVVVAVAVCDGSLALAFRELDGAAVVATSAWWWRGFGFGTASDLAGRGSPGCLDVDADGHLDPVLLRTATRDF